MFPGFDSNAVIHEWESIKQCVSEFINNSSSVATEPLFWKTFIGLKQAIDNNFVHQYKNILILLNIYLIAPTNSAEYERGVRILYIFILYYIVVLFSSQPLIAFRRLEDLV